MTSDIFIHPTADVSENSEIGAGTKIWNHVQVRENAKIGVNCSIGKGSYIDQHVEVGNNVKIQNGVSLYQGVTLRDGVFCGPHCVFTNDLYPRAVSPDLKPLGATDWEITPTLIEEGASIGANAVIRCGVIIRKWAMIGSGAVVTKDIAAHSLVYGNPARLHGFVCYCGQKLSIIDDRDFTTYQCQHCSREVKVDKTALELS